LEKTGLERKRGVMVLPQKPLGNIGLYQERGAGFYHYVFHLENGLARDSCEIRHQE
jgi:hypothetical protein